MKNPEPITDRMIYWLVFAAVMFLVGMASGLIARLLP